MEHLLGAGARPWTQIRHLRLLLLLLLLLLDLEELLLAPVTVAAQVDAVLRLGSGGSSGGGGDCGGRERGRRYPVRRRQ